MKVSIWRYLWWALLGRCLRCGKRRYFDGTTSCRKHYVEETIDVVHDIQREARQQALEEAAKECGSSAGLPDFVGSERMGAHVCARRIRALIDKPAVAKDPLCPTGECVGECDPEAHGLFSTRAKEEK